MRKPTGKALLLTCLITGLAHPALASSSRPDRPLSGRVLDADGFGVGGVSVFLTPGPVRSSIQPALVAPASFARDGGAVTGGSRGPLVLQTAADGAFAAMLPPGRYQVAAYKPGFDLVLTEVNVFVRGLLEIRLRAVNGHHSGERPPREPLSGLDWILRQNGGDVLRDTSAELPGLPAGTVEDEPAGRPPAPGGAMQAALGWLGRVAEPIDGRFAHLVGGPDPFAEDTGGDPSSRATTLGLTGAVGDQGRWWFDGASGRSALGGAGPVTTRQGRRAEQFAAALDWRLSPRGAVRTAIGYESLRYAAAPGDDARPVTDQVQKTALLRSRWDHALGDDASLSVDGLYITSGLSSEGPLLAEAGFDTGDGSRIDSVLRTTAALQLRRGDHALDFGARVGVYRHGLRDRGILIEAPFDAPLPIESGSDGQVVSLHGRDAWRITDLYSLTYGLGYHANPGRGQGYLAPRVGVTREPSGAGGVRLSSLLVFRLDDPFTSSPLEDGAAGAASPHVGCVLAIEGRPAEGTEIAASLSYLPFASDLSPAPAPGWTEMEGAAWPVPGGGIFGDELVFLTDGAAGRTALDVEVRRVFGLLHGSLTGSVGWVEGRVAPALDDGPAHFLVDGESHYMLTRLRALYAPTDTEVQVGWRRVAGGAESGAAAGGGPLGYRRIDVIVTQDLPRLSHASTRLRLLMAYQDLAYDAASEAAMTVPATASRLTGGVAIEF